MTYRVYCVNCGDQYTYWRSGYRLPKYNLPEYCPTCEEARKEAIQKALSVIPKKSKVISLETNEVDLDTLLKWEQDFFEKDKKYQQEMREKGTPVFPTMKRVSFNLYDSKNNEYSLSGYVTGVGDKEGRHYFYSYFPSRKNEAKITVSVRVDMEGKIIEYPN